MSAEPDIAELMERLRSGDQQAADLIFRRFARRLIGLARSRLHEVLRPKLDAEDIIQSVFKSFFHRQAEGQFALNSWESVWSLLTVMTLRKAGYHIRHFRTEGRDWRRELIPLAKEGDSGSGWEAIAREPTPSEAVLLTESLEQILAPLKTDDRLIVQKSLEGYSPMEISAQVGCSERTVYRVLDRVKLRLQGTPLE